MQMILMFKGSKLTRQMIIWSSNLSAIHRNLRNLELRLNCDNCYSFDKCLIESTK